MDTWHVAFFGGLDVTRGGASLRFATRKAAALFAFLTYHAGKSFSRDHLASLFWPDDDIERARNSLRVALSGLKKQVNPDDGRPLVHAERLTLTADPELVKSDVLRFHELLREEQRATTPEERRSALTAAARLYRGPFLDEWYEEWIEPERERLAGVYGTALQRLASLLVETGEATEALDIGRRSVELAPLREENHRFLIDLYQRCGQRDAALRQYRELERILQEELGIAPSPATRNLMNRPRAEARNADPLPPALPPPLPPRPALFLGRASERTELAHLLTTKGAQGVTVSLVGFGGVGKSCLVRDLLPDTELARENRVWYLPLEDARSGEDVTRGLARLLSLPDSAVGLGREAFAAACARALGDGSALVVLDDVDAPPAGYVPLLDTLRQVRPDLSLLVVARETPGLSGEQVLFVPPFPCPDGDAEGRESLARHESIQLFAERARSVNPTFTLDARTASGVATVCALVGGLPLAIEIAASWADLLTVDEIIRRLREDPFGFLVHRRADGSPRHRSLAGVLEACCSQLPESARAFAFRLAVFEEGWSVADAEAVTGETHALSAVALLQRHAAIQSLGSGESARFVMSPLPRRFALRVQPPDEREGCERRHAAHFVAEAERWGSLLNTVRAEEALERLRERRADLCAALDRCLGSLQEPTLALRLVAALWRFWYQERDTEPGSRYLEHALALAPDAPWEVRCAALEGAGRLVLSQGRLSQAVGLFQEALDLTRSYPNSDMERLGVLATNLSLAAQARSDYARVREVGKLLLALKRREQDLWGQAVVRDGTARAVEETEGTEAGRVVREETADLLAQLGMEWVQDHTPCHGDACLGRTSLHIGHLAVEQGDYPTALPLLRDALNSFRREGQPHGVAVTLERLGLALLQMGDGVQARQLLEEALTLRSSGVGRVGEPFTRRLLARAARASDDAYTVRTLLTEQAGTAV